MQIPAIETKRLYLQQIKKMHERWTRQLEGRELNIHIKEMHAHMIGNELKEEEELQKCEETLKKRKEELVIHERGLEKRKKVSHVFQLHSVVDHRLVMRASMSCCHVIVLCFVLHSV
jgi:hypothetical protein